VRPFRDLAVWQLAHELTLDIYHVSRDLPRHELYGLTSQLRRASSSIPTNIVEGSTRTDKMFRHYLEIALGSAAETEYLLLLARDLGYVPDEVHQKLETKTQSVKRMLVTFIKRLEE
jgi:four helix bundle protein